MSVRVAVLGESGVTGKAVLETLNRLDGYQFVADVQSADWVVASPGISPADFPITSVPVISEIEFAYRLFRRPESGYCPKLIGITGTNGKTTVTEMIAAITGAPACGNIGLPLITRVDDPSKPEWLVVELSSYQLETCTTFRPEIAVLTNITPDHLQRHGTMNEYARQKAKIFAAQTPEDCLIYFEDDPYIQAMVPACPSRAIGFSTRSSMVHALTQVVHLPGVHNTLNALAAVLAGQEAGISVAQSLEVLSRFRLADHRLEIVKTVAGVTFINDSKSTNPDSTMVAVRAFPNSHVLIGGKDKALDIVPLLHFLSQYAQSVIVFGEIAPRFYNTAQTVGINTVTQVVTLAEAVSVAKSRATAGDVILLSPACSSFDQFQNYEDRGHQFKALV